MKRRDVLTLLAATTAGATLGAGASRVMAASTGAALVLGGGGCRGHGHIGVIRVLEKHGLKPDLVVGSSAGSLVGALYAAGMTSVQIESYGQKLGANLLRDWIFPKLGLFGGDAIRRFVVDRVGALKIEAMPTRFAAIATDLKSGELKIFDRGDLGLAVQASSSIPGLIEPVHIDGRLYVDGSLTGAVPVHAARRLGAHRVIAVDVSFPPDQADFSDPYDALYQAFSILTRRLALEERATADLVIAPHLPEHKEMGPATLKALVEAGERAALEALPRLRALMPASAVRSRAN